MTMQIQYQFQKNDEYLTPAYAVYPITKRLPPGATVWCPFDKVDSAFVQVLSACGFHVIYGHIQTGQDFFKIDVPGCDYIISNPPYSLKSKVIKRLYELGKPFGMLINFQGIIDCQERFQMFKHKKVEMLWLSPRVNYIAGNGEAVPRAPFQSGYLCSGICKNQLEFEYLNKENEQESEMKEEQNGS